MPLDYSDWGMTGHTPIDLGLNSQKEQQLAQMCDLANDVPDDVRECTLKSLLIETFENYHYIETEEELREMILKRLLPEFIVVLEHLKIDKERYDQMWQAKRDAKRMQRMAQIFEASPSGNYELCNKEKGFCLIYYPEDQEIQIQINIFINPYTQNVEEVYQEKFDKLKYFTKIVLYENPIKEVEKIYVDKPSKLGFMCVELTILAHVADTESIKRVKDAIFQIQEEQLPYESPVWFKAEYDGHACYYEREWSSIKRAVIKGEQGFECYDLSDETKYDQKNCGIVTGIYDQLEYSDSFELISQAAFQEIWDKAEKDHEPESWE